VQQLLVLLALALVLVLVLALVLQVCPPFCFMMGPQHTGIWASVGL